MEVAAIIGAIILALLIGAMFYYGFKARGPWGSFWPLVLVLFLVMTITAIWVQPIGPVWWWGVAWLDLFIIGLLIALLLSAATPTASDRERHRRYYGTRRATDEEAGAGAAVAIGLIFWVLIIFFLLAAITGLIF